MLLKIWRPSDALVETDKPKRIGRVFKTLLTFSNVRQDMNNCDVHGAFERTSRVEKDMDTLLVAPVQRTALRAFLGDC